MFRSSSRATYIGIIRPMCCAGLVVFLVVGTSVRAQEHSGTGARQNAVVGATVGAAGGFGLGVLLGLALFDQALHADRKVWTTAIVSAVAGGLIGHLVARDAQPNGRLRGGTDETTWGHPRRALDTLNDQNQREALARLVQEFSPRISRTHEDLTATRRLESRVRSLRDRTPGWAAY